MTYACPVKPAGARKCDVLLLLLVRRLVKLVQLFFESSRIQNAWEEPPASNAKVVVVVVAVALAAAMAEALAAAMAEALAVVVAVAVVTAAVVTVAMVVAMVAAVMVAVAVVVTVAVEVVVVVVVVAVPFENDTISQHKENRRGKTLCIILHASAAAEKSMWFILQQSACSSSFISR